MLNNKMKDYYNEHAYSVSGGENLFSNIKHEDGIYDIENKIFI